MERPSFAGEQEISANAPAVSMDINLGKKYKYADFDYEAFAEVHQAVSGDENPDASDLQIFVGDKGNFGDLGYYDPDTTEIHIHKLALTLKGQEGANSTLVHELQHYEDVAPGEKPEKMYQLGIEAGRASNVLIPASLATFAGSYVASKIETVADYSETLKKTGGVLALGAVAVTAVGLAAYAGNEKERRARKAEHIYKQQIISLQGQ